MSNRKGSSGGQVMAIRQRKTAIDNYYKNPNVCLYCNKIINVQGGQKVSDVRRKKFCNHQCAATANNIKRGFNSKPRTKKCEMCGCEISLKRKTSNQGWYSKKKYCSSCLPEVQAKNMGADTHIANLTKKQIMNRYAKYYIGRSMIRKHAKKVFFDSNKDKKCLICGYEKYIEVCHKKEVRGFTDDALISEINNIGNLIALCPNHHIELDKNLMNKNDLKKVNMKDLIGA